MSTRTGARLPVVFAALLLALLMVALDQTTVAVALPTIVSELRGLALFPLVIIANLLAATVASPLAGRLSDLYGRKPLLIAAITAFLVGSTASGLAQDFTQLIAARAVQGLGAGGITVLAITTVGDLVPPRSRARYQGYLGAEFAVASVVGPLVGGLLTDAAGWRWIFFLNLPLGLLVLVAVVVGLHLPGPARSDRLDWRGALLLVGAVTCVVLVTTAGGIALPWTSPPILVLSALAVALVVVLVLVERRVAGPILPPWLFSGRTTGPAMLLVFAVGAITFSATTYLPVYLQVALGVSATSSGLLLAPLMAGIVVTSVVSGHVIALTGRYRVWPIAGTALVTLGVFLLSRLTADSSTTTAAVYAAVLGLGLGALVQVMVVIVQNAVGREDLGVATATTGLVRSVGGLLGVALAGAVFGNQLQTALTRYLPPELRPPGLDLTALQTSPAALGALPPPVREGVALTFASATGTTFLVLVPLGAIALVAALVLREPPVPADPTPPLPTPAPPMERT